MIDLTAKLAYFLRVMATRYCLRCQTTHANGSLTCPQCTGILSLKDPYNLVGRTLLERYKIEALVGLGGMGAVYCAFHQGIERRVALKILQPNIAIADERLVDLFEREARVAGRLTHENIVDIKDAGHLQDDAGHLAYIVMEWLDGKTLEDELRQIPAMSVQQTYEILRQIAAALDEAHSKSVVHRDLKPANVMLTHRHDGRLLVKVLDFGIGKIVNETGASVSAIMGTPSYASPEQLQLGGKLDHRSDIYSLGVMLYRMLSGRLPFSSESLTDLIQLQLQGTPVRLQTIRPDLPAAIDELIHQMLAKDAAQRPQNAQEVAARFAAGVNGVAEAPTLGTGWSASAPTYISNSAPAVRPNSNKTELMPEAPTPRRIQVNANGGAANAATVAKSGEPAQGRSLLVPGALLSVVLAGGGFALYRYASHAGSSQLAQVQPVPAATVSVTPSALSQKTESTAEPTDESPKVKPTLKANAPTPTATPASVATPNPTPTPVPENKSSLPLVVNKPAGNELPSSNTTEGGAEAKRWPVADGLYQQALKQYEAGNYSAALESCNKALMIRPMHIGARQLKRKLQSGMKILNDRQ